MVRGRTTAPAGLILGHEITGEVIEAGPDRRPLVIALLAAGMAYGARRCAGWPCRRSRPRL
jgi:glutathione-independent formaldehyde dehydrogenase